MSSVPSGEASPGPVPAVPAPCLRLPIAPTLIEEATRRSAVVWVALPGAAPRPVWHLWHEQSLYTVVGGLEQPLPLAAAVAAAQLTAVVTVRSKNSQNDQVVRWVARLSHVAPGTALWDEVVPLLHAKRLNPPDGADQPTRWAASSSVLRLTPTGERPG